MPDGEHMEHGVPVQRNAVVEYKREHELVLLVMNVEVLVQDPPLNQDIAVLHTRLQVGDNGPHTAHAHQHVVEHKHEHENATDLQVHVSQDVLDLQLKHGRVVVKQVLVEDVYKQGDVEEVEVVLVAQVVAQVVVLEVETQVDREGVVNQPVVQVLVALQVVLDVRMQGENVLTGLMPDIVVVRCISLTCRNCVVFHAETHWEEWAEVDLLAEESPEGVVVDQLVVVVEV